MTLVQRLLLGVTVEYLDIGNLKTDLITFLTHSNVHEIIISFVLKASSISFKTSNENFS